MKTICTKYVSLKEAKKLIKKARSGNLPEILDINEIAFLYSPYSENEQTYMYKKMIQGINSGELKTTTLN